MAVKLHRCSLTFVKGPHPCWQVQKALDEAGVKYELVPGPVRRGKRTEMVRLTGQKLYPAIEREDGSVVKKESGELIAMIRAGEFS
ncbi:MAG: glutathione S-transferase N-terminal domain-containing protein [Solirubrobacteraceae bacterium]|jgi:glutathione S-transferase